MSLNLGTKLGPYEILAAIGAGGMGEVYKAKDLKLGRDVAIKVLREDLASDPERLRRFEQEARAASSLNHPNIVTIYDIGEHEGTRYIAMEYVEGKTLRETLHGEPLPTKKLLKLSTQIADGLAKAHSAGIVHRDLKPENLMVTGDGFVKILDFGLAKLMPEPSELDSEMATKTKETREGVVLGTVQYMSPEQAAGRPVEYHSDQFSLGSVLYEMATGKMAFQKETAPETQAAIMRDEPEPISVLNPHVPAQLTHIIGRCLEKDPQGRYDSTRDLARELESVDELPLAALPTSRRLPLAGVAGFGLVAVLVVTAVALFTGDVQEWLAGDRGPPRIESIAVLPLTNLSGDPEQEYFVAGMHEELVATLSQISALTVISRTSAMQYKETDKSIPEIARELGVDALIEGSVRQAEGEVRITVQLVEAATDSHLWAESYQRELRDVLALQSEVAQAIAREITITVSPEEQARLSSVRVVDPEAYQLYLKGRFFSIQGTVPALEKSIEYFQQAIEMDPNFAQAYAGLVEAYGLHGQVASLPQDEFVPKMKKAALKALEIDDTLGEAHASLALIRMDHEWDWEGAEQEYIRAIELSPNYANAYLWYSNLLNLLGRHEEALAKVKGARELDPLNPFIASNVVFRYYYMRSYDQALQESRKVVEMFPDYWVNRWVRGMIFSAKGMHAEAVMEAQKAVELSEGSLETLPQLGHAYARAGRKAEAEKVLARFELESRNKHIPAYYFAMVYTGLGEKDRAFEWWEKSFQQHELVLPWSTVDPMADPLRDDPRFQELVRRMHFPEKKKVP